MTEEYTYEDLPYDVVTEASRAAAEKADMGSLHIGSHVVLSLVNKGLILFPKHSDPSVRQVIEQNEKESQRKKGGHKLGDKVWYADSKWVIVKKEAGGYWLERKSRGKSYNRIWTKGHTLIEVRDESNS